MRCPACKSPLVVVERQAIEVDWCLECRGLWFDGGEMELLGQKAGRRLETEDLGRRTGDSVSPGRRRCPRCRRRMERVTLTLEAPGPGAAKRVEIDRCPEHGIWLDRGELGRIMRRLAPVPGERHDTDEELVLGFLGETFVAAHEEPTTTSERRES